MKKILLIVAVVLCVAIAGTALAAQVMWSNAPDATGTITANSFVELSLEGTQTASITLMKGKDEIRKIHCGVVESDDEADGVLTISLDADTDNDKNLTGVTAYLYTDSGCNTPVLINAEPAVQVGAGQIVITDINASTDFYLKVTFDGAASEEALANVAGEINITFEQA